MGADSNKKSVEYQPSETAMATAFLRALASHDEREEIKGPDFLAEVFLNEERKRSLNDPKVRVRIMKNTTVPSMYAFLTARSAFFDYIVQQALRANIPQIVFLGAGYDTRTYRFKDLIQDTKIFEMDAQPTQRRKIEILRQVNVFIPNQLVFVPVNFETDDLKEALFKAGFSRDRKTLFIWEGVTYYLSAEVIDNTLNFVRSNSPVGSSICFDYAILSLEAFIYGNANKSKERHNSRYPGEPTKFGIMQGKLGTFLSERKFDIIQHFTSNEMQSKYLTLHDGSSVGIVPGHLCLVHASVTTYPSQTEDR